MVGRELQHQMDASGLSVSALLVAAPETTPRRPEERGNLRQGDFSGVSPRCLERQAAAQSAPNRGGDRQANSAVLAHRVHPDG